MKKTLLLLILVTSLGCSKSDDNVVDKIEIMSHVTKIGQYNIDKNKKPYFREDIFVLKNNHNRSIESLVYINRKKIGELTVLPKPGIYKYKIVNTSENLINIDKNETVLIIPKK